jgi:hypothetical protein
MNFGNGYHLISKAPKPKISPQRTMIFIGVFVVLNLFKGRT